MTTFQKFHFDGRQAIDNESGLPIIVELNEDQLVHIVGPVYREPGEDSFIRWLLLG